MPCAQWEWPHSSHPDTAVRAIRRVAADRVATAGRLLVWLPVVAHARHDAHVRQRRAMLALSLRNSGYVLNGQNETNMAIVRSVESLTSYAVRRCNSRCPSPTRRLHFLNWESCQVAKPRRTNAVRLKRNNSPARYPIVGATTNHHSTTSRQRISQSCDSRIGHAGFRKTQVVQAPQVQRHGAHTRRSLLSYPGAIPQVASTPAAI